LEGFTKTITNKTLQDQLLQALTAYDKETRLEFCAFILENEANDDNFLSRIVFSDKATFHINGTINQHNVRIWSMEHRHETVKHQRDSPRVNVFCAVSQKMVYGPFYFDEKTIKGASYL